MPHICAVFADVGLLSCQCYLLFMPYGLKRYHETKQSHFVTFSCFERRAHLNDPKRRDVFVNSLERVRVNYKFRVYGYVVMPEHVHLLVSEPEIGTLSKVMQALKVSVVRKIDFVREERGTVLWQKRYYDHNVRSHESFVEKLRYIHRNPVKRGLCVKPEDWKWSSFRHYATAETGVVEVESQWTADRRNGKIPRLL